MLGLFVVDHARGCQTPTLQVFQVFAIILAVHTLAETLLCRPTSATAPGEVDTVVEFGVLGYEDSRLAAQMDAQNDNLIEQREAITSCLAADGKAKQAQEKLQQAEQELQTWLTKYEAELEKALQATGASSSNKRKGGTASQPAARKRVRS